MALSESVSLSHGCSTDSWLDPRMFSSVKVSRLLLVSAGCEVASIEAEDVFTTIMI